MSTFPIKPLLAACPLFANFTAADLEKIIAGAHRGHSHRHQFVFMPDEIAHSFFVLLSGSMRIGYFAPDGQAIIKEFLKPGAIFGAQSLLGQTIRPDFALSSHEESSWISIQVTDFQQFMQSNFSVTRSLLLYLNGQLNHIEDRLGSLVLKDARQRIIGFLHDAAHRDGRKVGHETVLKHQLSQQDIANLTGTSRQTVTSVLNALRKANLIHFNRHSILIRDLEKLT